MFPDVERRGVGGKRIHPLLVCDVPSRLRVLGAVLGDHAAKFVLNFHVSCLAVAASSGMSALVGKGRNTENLCMQSLQVGE